MNEFLLPIYEIGPEGQELVISEQELWSGALGEFHIPAVIIKPLQARVQILPGADGVLIRGRLTGSVSVPCDRCAGDAVVEINYQFDEFEEIREQTDDNSPENKSDDGIILFSKAGPLLDLGGLLWEEFVLALPTKPLCSPECKGICPRCGINFNQASCACSQNDGDARLAMLKNYKVN